MIKAISFDLDGTLASDSFDRAVWHEELPRLYAKKHNLTLEQAKEKVYSTYYVALDIEKEKRWTDISYWMDRLELGDWKPLVERLKNKVFVYDDVYDVLDELHKKYRLIIISNAEEKFLNIKLEAEKLKKYFDCIFSAPSHFGIARKNKAAFLEIIKKLKLKPEEIVHVGDDHELDYLVPSELSMHAFHLIRGSKRKGKHISTLHELPEKIKGLS
ncbi:HAD family hydrolase [Candidatus Woesearchaeota archaeon]|nr:HAD family hydrolase [Candidatus Woesearchaeota archaeon]